VHSHDVDNTALLSDQQAEFWNLQRITVCSQ